MIEKAPGKEERATCSSRGTHKSQIKIQEKKILKAMDTPMK